MSQPHNQSPLPPGTKLRGGKYSVGKALGIGAAGITYLGADKAAGRPVAIKELFPGFATRAGSNVIPGNAMEPAIWQRTSAQFVAEGNTLSTIFERGVVRVLDAFQENGTAYLVMESLKGRSLKEQLAVTGKMTPEQVEEIGVTLSQALQAVHDNGLVHRDIHPGHLFYCDDGRVVLLDFGGIRQMLCGKGRGLESSLVVGYAAPEQYSSHGVIGPAADIYGLCATLFHCLTGKPPAGALDRGNGAPLGGLRGISPGLARAIEHGLALQQGDRPRSARQLAEELADKAAPVTPKAPPVPSPVTPPPAPLPPAVPVPPAPWPPSTPPPAAPMYPAQPPPLNAPVAQVPTPIVLPSGFWPRSRWHVLEISAHRIDFPRVCACCEAPAETTVPMLSTRVTGKRVVRTQTKSWDLPYCGRCAKHTALIRQGNAALGWMTGLSVPIFLVMALAKGLSGGVFMGGLVFGFGLLLWYLSRVQAKGQLTAGCCNASAAGEYRGWYGSIHTFAFRNVNYLRRFEQANGRKIIG